MKLPFNCKQHNWNDTSYFLLLAVWHTDNSVHIIQQHTCKQSNQSDKSCPLLLPVWHIDNSMYITQYVPYVKYVSHTELIKICQEFWPLYKQMKQDDITR